MFTVTIDDKDIQVPPKYTILEAAQELGIYIPTICYDKKLLPFGACRMCVVEVEGLRGRLIPACTTPVADKMIVRTNTQPVIKARQTVLELLLITHPLDCPVCDKAAECTLQNHTFDYGVKDNRFTAKRFDNPVEMTNPFVERNLNRCVLCGKCVRVCDEIIGAGAISFVKRGFDSKIGTAFDKALDCEFCGECIAVCEVGALNDRIFKYKARPWQLEKIDSVCGYCGTGCLIEYNVKDGKIVRITSSDNKGINSGILCVRGRFGHQFVNSKERLIKPLVRKEGELVEAGWEEAIDKAVAALKEAGSASAGFASARITNEEAYLFQKLFRDVLKSNNIDTSAGFTYSGALTSLKEATGVAGSTASLDDLKEADLVVFVGGDISQTNPVAGYKLNWVKRDKESQKLLILNTKSTKYSKKADVEVICKEGTLSLLLNVVSKALVEKGDVDISANGFDAFKTDSAGFAIDDVLSLCGVTKEDITKTVDILSGNKKAVFILTSALSEVKDYPSIFQAAANIAILNGSIGNKGSGILYLSDKCNSQGLLDMGINPSYLPGYVNAQVLGLGAYEAMEKAEAGMIKTLFIAGEDPVSAYPNREKVLGALKKVPHLIVSDLFFSETAKLAEVVFPAASFAEKEGTITNFERRIQKIARANKKTGEAKEDLEILTALANGLQANWNYKTSGDVLAEIKQKVDLYRDVEAGSCWPDRFENIPFEKLALNLVWTSPSFKVSVQPAGEFELLTGPVLHQNGILSFYNAGMRKIIGDGYVLFNPSDARRISLEAGESVKLTNGKHSVVLPVKKSNLVSLNTVFVPYGIKEAQLNGFFTEKGERVFVKIEKA